MPAAHRAAIAARPSSWHLSANGPCDRVVTYLAGYENGAGSDALCVRTAKDEFVRTHMGAVPGPPCREARWATLAWDAKGKNVALALLDAVHVWRVKRSGQTVLRGSFLKLPDCGVAGVALVETPLCHFLFCLLYDGRLMRLTLPAGVNCGLHDCQGAVVSDVGAEWRPTCLAYHHGRKLFALGGALPNGAFACALYSAAALSSAERCVTHEWSSWRETGIASQEGLGCLSQLRFSPSGDRVLCGSERGLAVLTCNLEKGPSVAPLTTPFVPSSFAWFGESKVVLASYKLGRLELLDQSGASTRISEQPMHCSQLSNVSQGRFFLLNCSHREYAATQITREKILKMQSEAQRAATMWGSVVNSVHSYLTYFNVPTLNTRGGLTTRDEFHVTVYFDSFLPQQLVAKKLALKKWDEALQIARTHRLPTDDIFKARLGPQRLLSAEDLAETLGAIEDVEWVLRFCLNRVPADAEEARRVLAFGVRRAGGAEWEQYHVLLEESSARLETYLEATSGAWDSPDWKDFARQDLAVAAIVHALHGRAALVTQLWRRHGRDLLPFRFAILESFPETLSCALYAEMLPKCSDQSECEGAIRAQERRGSEALRRAVAAGEVQVEGWTPLLQALLFPKERLRVLEREYVPVDFPAPLEAVADWYLARVLEVDDTSGQLVLCTELLAHAPPPAVGNARLAELRERLDEARALVYSLGQEQVSLRQYAQMEPFERCALFLQALHKGNVAAVLARARKVFGNDFDSHLKRFVRERASPPVAELIFAQSAPAVVAEARPFLEVRDFMESVLEAANASTRPEDVPVWRRVLKQVPARLTHTGDRTLEALHDRLDRLEASLDACEMLGRLGLATGVAGVQQLQWPAVLARSRKQLLHRGADWTSVLRDLLALRQLLFAESVPQEAVYAHYVACAVSAKQPLERVLKYAPECGGELARQAVAEAAGEVVDGCNGLDSPDLQYVREVLAHFPDRQLSNTLEAAAMLKAIGVRMIPLQLRVWKNQSATDVLTRVCAAVARQDTAGSAELGWDDCGRLSQLLGTADPKAAARALRAAFAESDLKRGLLSRAVQTCVELEDAELALKCLVEGRQLAWADAVRLGGVALARGPPACFARVLRAVSEAEKRQPAAEEVPKERPPVAYDPLLDDPLPKRKEKEQPKAKEEEAEPDDIAGIAKKAWGNFFGNK